MRDGLEVGTATLAAATLRSAVAAASSVCTVARSASVESSSSWRRAAAETSFVSRLVRFSMRASCCRSAGRGEWRRGGLRFLCNLGGDCFVSVGVFRAREEFLPSEHEALGGRLSCCARTTLVSWTASGAGRLAQGARRGCCAGPPFPSPLVQTATSPNVADRGRGRSPRQQVVRVAKLVMNPQLQDHVLRRGRGDGVVHP